MLVFFTQSDFFLKGGNAVVDGCGATQNGTETDVEEYTLMSIDTIINGKVRSAIHAVFHIL